MGVSGAVHFDTFSLAVAEALAAGVIVLAPRIAALPYLYEGLVVWVDPPAGLSGTLRRTTHTGWDDSGLSSEAMVQAYVTTIRDLLANATRRAELRARARLGIRERFGEEAVVGKLYHHFASPHPPPAEQPATLSKVPPWSTQCGRLPGSRVIGGRSHWRKPAANGTGTAGGATAISITSQQAQRCESNDCRNRPRTAQAHTAYFCSSARSGQRISG